MPTSHGALDHDPLAIPVAVGRRYATGAHPSDPAAEVYRVMPLAAALEQRWASDHHLATYVLSHKGARLQKAPRLRKALLPEVTDAGYTVQHHVRFADCDTAGHVPIARAQLLEIARALKSYPCGWYPTRAGVRIFQVLTRALSPEEYEVSIGKWLPELRWILGALLTVDDACDDWTRLFRLPRVVRDGRNYWDTPVLTKNLTVVDPGDCTPPPPPPKAWAPAVVAREAELDSRYGLAALKNAVAKLQGASPGTGHKTLASVTPGIGALVAGGELRYETAERQLLQAISGWDIEDRKQRVYERTIQDQLAFGAKTPKRAPARPDQADLGALRRWIASRQPVVIEEPDHGFGLEEV